MTACILAGMLCTRFRHSFWLTSVQHTVFIAARKSSGLFACFGPLWSWGDATGFQSDSCPLVSRHGPTTVPPHRCCPVDGSPRESTGTVECSQLLNITKWSLHNPGLLSARMSEVLAMATCLSVCLSVCLSATSLRCIETADHIELVLCYEQALNYHEPRCDKLHCTWSMLVLRLTLSSCLLPHA